MNNPNCPDAQYPEFNPATGECFNITTVETSFKQYQENTNTMMSAGILITIAVAVTFLMRKI
jgi:hypothetical protein